MESYLPGFDVESSPDVKYGKALLLLSTGEKLEGEKREEILRKAEDILIEACNGFDEKGFFYEKALALTTLGELFIMEGKEDKAREVLLEAMRYFQGYSNQYMIKKIEEMLMGLNH